MKVQWVEIERLKPYENNPRKRSEEAVKKIAESITAFGWQQPIVVDKDYVIIIGHGRLEAAKLIELDKVPVVVAGNLPPEKVKALRLADNRTNRESDWEIRLLMQEIEELKDIDIALVTQAGFTEDDLKRIADDLDETTLKTIAGSSTVEDDLPTEILEPHSDGQGDELVAFTEVMTADQRKIVNAAILSAKQQWGLERRGDALFHICEFYLEEKDEKL